MNAFYKIYLFAVLISLINISASSQKLYEKIIYSFQTPINIEKAWWFTADTTGDFCFQYRIDTLSYFITRYAKIGPFDFIGALDNLSLIGDYDEESKDLYYRSQNSTQVFGPVSGKIIGYSVPHRICQSVSIILLRGDSVFYYINDSLLFADIFYGDKDSDMNFKYTYKYCVFNDKGDVILKVNSNNKSYLYHNFNLVDSAALFDDLVIGYVNYGYEIKDDGGSWFVRRNLRTNSVIEAHGTASENLLDCEYNEENIVQSRSKTYTDFDAKLTVCPVGDKGCKISYNGKESEKYDNIYCECADSSGNYSYFALKDYYLYPVVNGIKRQPLSKYGVRANPLQISPTGNYFVYYKTDDSIYFYKNDKKILNTFSSKVYLRIEELNRMFGDYESPDEYENENTYMWIDTISCILIKDKFFGPYQNIYRNFDREKGDIINCKILENGFYFIQSLGDHYYQLVYNGTEYEPVLIAGEVLRNSAYVTSGGIVFYASDGRFIYEYSTYER